MQSQPNTPSVGAVPTQFTAPQMHLDWGNKRAWVSGHFATKAAAQELIDFAKAVMPTLPDESEKVETSTAPETSSNEDFD